MQKLVQPVSFLEEFSYEDKKVRFKISSESGLEFLDEGINKYHNFGFKNCYSYDKKRRFDIFYQYWLSNPYGINILFFHGNAENSSTHPKFFYHLLLNGYNIFTFDNIGHGSSSGLRGSIEKYSDYIDVSQQIFSFFNQVFEQNNNIKTNSKKNSQNIQNNIQWVVIGFSFGGLIATDFVLKDNSNLIDKLILFAPWFATNKRLINNITKIYLTIFKNFFKYDDLLNLKLQKDIFEMDTESYIKLNKNLTDNSEFLRIRKKDTRIFRVISKRRLAEIYNAQKKLLKEKIKKNYEKLSIYSLIPEKDYVVDSEITKKFIRKINGEIFELKNCFHDFLDYSNGRWNEFTKILNICLTKIVK